MTLFDGLIARDLVARVPVPQDRRAVTLHLTPAGEALMPYLFDRMARHEQKVIDRIGAPALATLLDMLHQLTELG